MPLLVFILALVGVVFIAAALVPGLDIRLGLVGALLSGVALLILAWPGGVG